MKIVFYVGGFAPIGGIETFCKNLLIYLQSKHYNCRLVCWGKSSPLLQSIEQAQIKITRTSWQWGCRWNLPDWLLLPLGIQQVKQADVVILSKLFPLQILKILKFPASKDTKFVFITAYRPSEIYQNLESRDVLAALNIFDLILVQSFLFIEDLRKIGYQGQIESLPLIPHQAGKIKALPPKEELKIGFLGRLVEDKNIPLLIKAFGFFQEKYSQVYGSIGNQHKKTSLHLFGDGHLREQLEQLAAKIGIASSVIFHGSIPNSEVEEAIASCHLFAFTSRTEGQCLAALEILGCGRPIVAINAGALPDILSDSRLGRVVQSSDPNTFADSLMQMANSLERESISPETIRSAYLERYAPEKVGNRYKELLDCLCK